MLAVAAAILYAIAFVLHWAAKGTNPFDVTGVLCLASACLAVHLALAGPWRYRRP